jgi:hypothetical protein
MLLVTLHVLSVYYSDANSVLSVYYSDANSVLSVYYSDADSQAVLSMYYSGANSVLSVYYSDANSVLSHVSDPLLWRKLARCVLLLRTTLLSRILFEAVVVTACLHDRCTPRP